MAQFWLFACLRWVQVCVQVAAGCGHAIVTAQTVAAEIPNAALVNMRGWVGWDEWCCSRCRCPHQA